MKKIFLFLGLLIGIQSIWSNSEDETLFGYISYSSLNIGDDIQAIAAKRFLPKNCVPIDREFVGVFSSSKSVSTIINGFFLHTKQSWYRKDAEAPEVSWPPAPNIDPLIISIYFHPTCEALIFSLAGYSYLKQHAPIGARDLITLQRLQAHGIPSYFSGCLTLTLDNPYKDLPREKVIYAVDIPSSCLRALKSRTKCRIIEISHGLPWEMTLSGNHEIRMAYAENLLEKYRRALAVVTSRFHACMPCLGIETPVLLIKDQDERFCGHYDLVRHCTEKQFLSNEYVFDFDNPSPNSKDYLPLREQMIQTVNEWIKKHSSNYESPK